MIWFGIAFIVAFYISCIIANMVDCIPVNQLLPGLEPAEWIEASKRDRCSKPELTLTLIQGVISMLTDFYGNILQDCLSVSNHRSVTALWATTHFLMHPVYSYSIS